MVGLLGFGLLWRAKSIERQRRLGNSVHLVIDAKSHCRVFTDWRPGKLEACLSKSLRSSESGGLLVWALESIHGGKVGFWSSRAGGKDHIPHQQRDHSLLCLLSEHSTNWIPSHSEGESSWPSPFRCTHFISSGNFLTQEHFKNTALTGEHPFI